MPLYEVVKHLSHSRLLKLYNQALETGSRRKKVSITAGTLSDLVVMACEARRAAKLISEAEEEAERWKANCQDLEMELECRQEKP